MSSFQTTREQYSSALKRFLDSPKDFEVITSVARAGETPRPPSAAHTEAVLYVLDSSFNPPTNAHVHIAGSAIVENWSQPVWGKPSRVLLLLATQNADKPSKPASFEDRLIMMQLCAQDLIKSISAFVDAINYPVIDIGVTKKPYFVDKATAIENAEVYPPSLQQVHLTGYDTLIRIFNTKYYPPEHTLAPLEPFLSKHKLRVTTRPDDEWGSKAEQGAYLADLAQGGRESEGGKREWAKQIELVRGSMTEKRPVSSTKAREATQANTADLGWLVPDSVRAFVLSEKPYSE
ncbi:nicotinate-nicotinamide nucleotide adenylyltransferase [Aspergillus undulatus]|uniref:nicotinate-nicotinamide nucleotide adenylyltransferase n=1 Tax=Aspergillus undulatus TaxID=1810928 RepID=UPI003CCE18F5